MARELHSNPKSRSKTKAMAEIVGNSDFKFENSSLKVSFTWKFNGHSFGEFIEYNDRCKHHICSTEKVRFHSGFLGSTNHYIKCFVTLEDCNMYVKVYFEEDIKLPSDFTDYDLCVPKVGRRFDGGTSSPGSMLNDSMKTQLVHRRFFTNDDFEIGRTCKMHWYFWNSSSMAGNSYQQLKNFNGKAITLDFDFDYCFWNRHRKQMNISIPGDENARLLNEAVNSEAVLWTKRFLFSPKFSDFIIQCGDKAFETHRIIIASKSIVFAAMLQQPLKETKEGKLVIDDFEPKAVEEFLRFIYTGQANIHDYATELFKLSNKYEIFDLKLLSEAELIAQVNEGNLAETNELGKLFNSERLQEKCYSFFKFKRTNLVKTTADVDRLHDFMLRYALE